MQSIVIPFIHFAALLGFIVYKTKAPFGQFVRGRHQDVLTGLNKSKVQATEAANRKAEIESKLRGLEAEKLAIAAEWKEREQQQIRALQESTQRVLGQLKIDAQLNRKSLEESFRSKASRAFALLVLEKAEQKLKSSLNPDLHKKINQEFTQELMGA